MEIIIIAAVARNGVIGKDGKLPWHIPEDLEHFKRLTEGYPCIMGINTYHSLPIKPLPGRENIVLTSKDIKIPGATVKHSLEEALEYCKDREKVFICGGGSVYRQAMELADTIELTLIDKDYEGDTYFPEIDKKKWKLVNRIDRNGFSFLTYSKKN
ncbi:MAG: dihydrofolate reductase [Candidatus Aenigmatarchaeota archaeon]